MLSFKASYFGKILRKYFVLFVIMIARTHANATTAIRYIVAIRALITNVITMATIRLTGALAAIFIIIRNAV